MSKLGICTTPGLPELLGIVGSGTKAMGVLYVSREVQCPGNSFAAAADNRTGRGSLETAPG